MCKLFLYTDCSVDNYSCIFLWTLLCVTARKESYGKDVVHDLSDTWTVPGSCVGVYGEYDCSEDQDSSFMSHTTVFHAQKCFHAHSICLYRYSHPSQTQKVCLSRPRSLPTLLQWSYPLVEDYISKAVLCWLFTLYSLLWGNQMQNGLRMLFDL